MSWPESAPSLRWAVVVPQYCSCSPGGASGQGAPATSRRKASSSSHCSCRQSAHTSESDSCGPGRPGCRRRNNVWEISRLSLAGSGRWCQSTATPSSILTIPTMRLRTSGIDIPSSWPASVARTAPPSARGAPRRRGSSPYETSSAHATIPKQIGAEEVVGFRRRRVWSGPLFKMQRRVILASDDPVVANSAEPTLLALPASLPCGGYPCPQVVSVERFR